MTTTPTGPPTAPPGWYPSPFDSDGYAWFDGWYWHRADVEPDTAAETRRFFPTIPTLRLPAAWLGFAAVGVLMVTNLLQELDSEIVVAFIGLFALGFNVVGYPAVAAVASYRFGTGRPVRDLGLRARLDDLWIGPVGAIALLIIAIVTGLLVQAIGLPEGSNLDELEELGQNAAVFALMFVLAGVIAPITEELIFRGVIQRALSSRISPIAALFVQGVAFGCAHFLLNQGWGNVGLLFSLSCLGIGLGFIAHLTGRLIPAMIAHSLFNCSQLALLWISLGASG